MKLFLKLSKNILVLLVCCLGLSACEVEKSTKSSPFPEFRVSGNEVWEVGEQRYSIAETSIIVFPNSKPFLAVKVLVNEDPSENNEKEAKAIAKYAYKNGYLDRAMSKGLSKDGSKVELSNSIGVSLLHQKGTGPITKNNGYNFSFNESELL